MGDGSELYSISQATLIGNKIVWLSLSNVQCSGLEQLQ